MLVHVTYPKDSGKRATKLYFSTDIEMNPNEVLQYYLFRFQIEFLYRDGKQHTGLNEQFINVFGICPHAIKNQNYVKELTYYGTMAA